MAHNITLHPALSEARDRRQSRIARLIAMVLALGLVTAILTGDTPREEAAKAIDAINEGLPHYRRIRSFHLSPEPFSIENGLLTANSKLRRKAIEAHYADAIERLYA